MNYIGSKHTLSSFIYTTVTTTVGQDLSNYVFCDLFAGTGIVGRVFKPHVQQVIMNDTEYYSYVLNYNAILINHPIPEINLLHKLNALKGVEGFIFNEYGEGGSAGRLYFSRENAKKIDAIRQQIETWKTTGEITLNGYYFLLATLIESADKVANTASVYGAYLKKLKVSAQKSLEMRAVMPVETSINTAPVLQNNKVFQKDANLLIKEITGDILYLDPPYNARQYGANYHLLTTIAKYDTFVPKGKTGLREYYKSDYCSKPKVVTAFKELIENARFKYIFLSYNNEGLMSQQEVKKVMSAYGNYSVVTKKYQRFKADKTENRNHKADSTLEYLHILEKK